jgi:hypothetical protein
MSRHFPNWIKAYVDHTALSESPTTFHFWTAVSTVAGALRRRVWHSELIYEWTPNFYVVLVAPPGVVAKSTSIGIGMAMLKEVPDIHFGPQSMTWQALTQSLEDALEAVVVPMKGGKTETIPMCCLTIAASELGSFLKTEDSVLVDVLTDLWDARRVDWAHRTKTTGEVVVQNPWINLIGATTPSWIKEHIPESMIGGGFASRVVFVYADKKRHLVAYPSRQVRPENFETNRRFLVEDLRQIADLKGHYEMTEEAYMWGEEWYARHNETVAPHMASERYRGYLARKQGHIHKLAMVLAAAKRDELIIEVEDLTEADGLTEIIERDMNRVFESVGVVPEARHTSELVNYVRVHKILKQNELYRQVANTMSQKDFVAAVRAAVESGQLVVTKKDGERAFTLPAKREDAA